MSYTKRDYYSESISEALVSMGKDGVLTPEEIDQISEAVETSRENESIAFYTPPASDFYAREDREAKARLAALQAEFDRYRENAETAVKRALNQRSDANVGIGNNGEVTRYDGRSDRIL